MKTPPSINQLRDAFARLPDANQPGSPRYVNVPITDFTQIGAMLRARPGQSADVDFEYVQFKREQVGRAWAWVYFGPVTQGS